MKRAHLFIIVVFGILLSTPAYAGPLFSIFETNNAIRGGAQIRIYGDPYNPFPPIELDDGYGETSEDYPLHDQVRFLVEYWDGNTLASAESIAQAGYVMACADTWVSSGWTSSGAYARSEVVFSPNFTGYTPTLFFEYFLFNAHSELSLIDLTSGNLILDGFDPHFSNPEGAFAFDFYWWDSKHTYSLTMWASAQAQGGDVGEGFFKTNMLELTAVPEPSTLLLLASGLAGLTGLRRKLRK